MKGVYETVIITISSGAAAEINRTYQDEGVKAFPWTAHWSGRAKRIIVFPAPVDWEEDLRKKHGQAVRQAEARLIYQGELVRL